MKTETPGNGPISRLPPEILREIFSYFQDPRILGTGHLEYDGDEEYIEEHSQEISERRRTIASARLTCRLLNDAASEFLLPQLIVSLDQASLDKAESYTKNPLFARGVHALRLRLAYRPKELTVNKFEFLQFRIKCMNWHKRAFYGGSTGYDSESIEKCKAVLKEWRKEAAAISGAVMQEDDADDSELSAEYRRILRGGFAEFQRKHEEQRQLVESGSFVRQLVALMLRLSRCRTLIFCDGDDWGALEVPSPRRPAIGSMAALSEWLVAPYPWSAVESLSLASGRVADGELAPARLLVEIPMALHRAGRVLRHFRVDYSPKHHWNIALLAVKESAAAGLDVGGLQSAFGGLETAVLAEAKTTPRGTGFDRFLAALSSSDALTHLRVGTGGGPPTVMHMQRAVRPNLLSLLLPNLRHVEMSFVEISVESMARFCDSVDISRVSLDFWCIFHDDGPTEDWEAIVISLYERAHTEQVSMHAEWEPETRLECHFRSHPVGEMTVKRCNLC